MSLVFGAQKNWKKGRSLDKGSNREAKLASSVTLVELVNFMNKMTCYQVATK